MAVIIIPNPTQGVNVLNFPSAQAVSGTVSVSNFPPTVVSISALQGFVNQLQRLADLQESALLELKVISISIAQLNDGISIDPDELRSNVDLAP